MGEFVESEFFTFTDIEVGSEEAFLTCFINEGKFIHQRSSLHLVKIVEELQLSTNTILRIVHADKEFDPLSMTNWFISNIESLIPFSIIIKGESVNIHVARLIRNGLSQVKQNGG